MNTYHILFEGGNSMEVRARGLLEATYVALSDSHKAIVEVRKLNEVEKLTDETLEKLEEIARRLQLKR